MIPLSLPGVSPPFLGCGDPPDSPQIPPAAPTMQLFIRGQTLLTLEVSGSETLAQIKVSPQIWGVPLLQPPQILGC